MKKAVKQEIEELIKKEELNCSVKEFKDKVGWYSISVNQKLSEDFIREFQDKVDWVSISIHQKLSEDFIREFQDKVDWNWISHSQKLSENFIREFKDEANWNWISYYQKLSEDFIYEFQDILDISELIKRKLITQKRLEELGRKEKQLKRPGRTISYRFEILDL